MRIQCFPVIEPYGDAVDRRAEMSPVRSPPGARGTPREPHARPENLRNPGHYGDRHYRPGLVVRYAADRSSRLKSRKVRRLRAAASPMPNCDRLVLLYHSEMADFVRGLRRMRDFSSSRDFAAAGQRRFRAAARPYIADEGRRNWPAARGVEQN